MSEALCSGVYASDNTTDGGLVAQEVENTKSSGKYIKSKKKNTKSKSGKYKKLKVYASDNTTDGGLVAQEVGGKVLQSTTCNENNGRLRSTCIFLRN